MHAVIMTGGKQYRVTEGQTLKIEKLIAEAGSTVDFPVLMITDGDQIKVGAPYLTAGKVEASVIGEGRGEKIHIVKFRRRKHHRKQMGHRQYYTEVKITKISLGN
jgi:large subunit ribosomal protein L21